MKEENTTNGKDGLKLKVTVFFPPVLFLILTIIYSLQDNAAFIKQATHANQWILEHFDWLFTWTTFLFLLVLLAVYLSPLGKVKIGGRNAKPFLTRWRWFAITLCTTVATGILFWGTAEPLYHLHDPPAGLTARAGIAETTDFAMSTMFMHWSFTPYGIYTIAGLIFALTYYNLKQPFSISSLVYPLIGSRAHGTIGLILDIICLYGLAAGMAASLGTGIFALMGGLESILGLSKSGFVLGMICLTVVSTFIVSAVSGLKRGIRLLSGWNTQAFFVLALLVFTLGPTAHILEIGRAGIIDYLSNFIPRSTNMGFNIEASWQHDWTIFYFANWFAWAPIAALFLGRLSLGYTVRDFIHFNLLFPAIFTCVWMVIFSGSALAFDLSDGGALYEVLRKQGEQNVMYEVLGKLSAGKWISLFALAVVFISYVTAADSNVSAMSAVSSVGINPENPEAPLWIKIVWGSLIGLIAWIMITSAGVDGIRLMCVLGGFPALFLIIGVGAGIIRLMADRSLLD